MLVWGRDIICRSPWSPGRWKGIGVPWCRGGRGVRRMGSDIGEERLTGVESLRIRIGT